jgi:hypothetical protein
VAIALAPVLFAAPSIAAGLLVPIGTRRMMAVTSYRMTLAHEPEDAPFVLQVKDWLRAEARLTTAER